MATPYERLLTEAGARQVLLAEITHRDEAGVLSVERLGQEAWTTDRTEPAFDLPFLGRSLTLNVEVAIDKGETLGGVATPEYGVLEVSNLDRRYDSWRGHSVDGLSVRILMVGELADGTKITYSEAAASPLVNGRGVGSPKPGEAVMTVAYQGELYKLQRVLNRKKFSPPCPLFPGTAPGCVDFGNVHNASGSFTREFWISTSDPGLAGQTIFSKDTGASGFYLSLGDAGSGALRFGVRNQTPATTDTAAGVIRINQDHHVAVVWDASAATRTIYVDRVVVATTASITGGTPPSNVASFKVGTGFKGKISQGRMWGSARTPAEIDRNMLLPILASSANLVGLPLMEEGKGNTTRDSKTGGVGALGAGVTWTTSTWCGSSLVGKRWPVVLGMALDLPLTPIDPARGIFATSWPPPVIPPTVRSNHNALTSGAQYSYEGERGLVTLQGAANGKYSADVAGETLFGSALSLNGSSSSANTALACPPGSMALCCLVRPRSEANSLKWITGYRNGAAAGLRALLFDVGATNFLNWVVRNDSGTVFVASSAALPAGRWTHVAGVLDVGLSQIRLYLDARLVATTPVTGTFSSTLSAWWTGREPTTPTWFFDGDFDEPLLLNTVPSVADLEALVAAPAVAGQSSIAGGYHLDDAAGAATAASFVVGGPTLTLTNCSSVQSRIAAADLLMVVSTHYGGYGNHSVVFDGISGTASGTASCPPGPMSITVWMRPDSLSTSLRRVGGWTASDGPGCRQLELSSGTNNLLTFKVVNDAGTPFLCSYLTAVISPNVWSAVVAVLDVPNLQARLYLDGFLVQSVPISGTFNLTSTSFAWAANSTSAAAFFPGAVDEGSVWNLVLSTAQIAAFRAAPISEGTPGLVHLWHADEGQETQLVNAVAGAGDLTLTGGFAWQSGSSPSGLPVTAPKIDTSAVASFLRASAADCGWVIDDSSSCAAVADAILRGVHSWLRPDAATGRLQMGQVSLSTGTPDSAADLDGTHRARTPMSPADDRIEAPVYLVNVRHGRNHNPMSADQLAGILTTQPSRYQFGIRDWGDAPVADFSILDDYPQARELAVDSPLLWLSDALREAGRVLPFYAPERQRYVIEFLRAALTLQAAGECRVTAEDGDGNAILGMGSPGRSFRTLAVRRSGQRVTLRVLA